jgi:hypothetical protein
VLTALAACGSGGSGGYGGGSNAPPASSATSVPYTAGVFQPRGGLVNQCASSAAQNNFLRSWSNELYLWYRELPDVNPNGAADVIAYFNQLKTPALTASGQPKDRFHFTYDTDDWIALSQSGVEAGYGAEWFLASTTPPRRILVAYTEPNSPASAAGVMRGFEVLTVDGADAVNGNTQAVVDALNAGVFPSSAGQSHTFTMRDLAGATRTVTMTSANVTSTPVPTAATINTGSGLVGYLVFHDHIATSEAGLIAAINSLKSQNIVDLVLDIRYNGGGYLDIASALGYMIGGGMTVGKTFERLTFNDKHPTTNPVTQQPLAPTPFHTTGRFGSSAGAALPTLDLPQPRVYVLTGRNTCSASEAIINGLRGADVEVYQIGSTTCGKPYGFYSQDNCGTTYFSIQFQGDNAKGFGAYSDGFSPNNTSGVAGERLPGCSVADDFSRALGDQNEARLAAALAFRESGNQASACPAATGFAPGVYTKLAQPLSIADGVMLKSPARENRILQDMT